jgi:hypothetical protein
METEREKDRGEYWEEPSTLELDLAYVWGWWLIIKEKVKDIYYESTKFFK